jgi:Immunoglobulin domain/PA14 domain
MEVISIFFRVFRPFSAKSGAVATLFATALLMGLYTEGVVAQPANTVMVERWDNINGTLVSDLTSNANYPNNPNSRTYVGIYEIPTNSGDAYGTRTRGYVIPPTSGNYTFWVSGDDNTELWLGTNDNPSTIQRIAHVPGWSNPREWGKFPEQQSTARALTAGVRYYIETRQKEGWGGDNLAVGWQGPGISGDAERPIPGSRLAPFLLSTPPVITTQPASQTVIAGQTATFSVTATGTAPLTYQWRRNGGNISGATSASYTTPPTTVADQGVQFSVVVTNSAGTVTSSSALLNVNFSLPSITTQPTSQTVSVGQTATFSVTATSAAPLSYQWLRNASSIPGATSPTYTTPPTTAADNGVQFSVVVSNASGSVTSFPAQLLVLIPPTITTQPAPQTVNAGQTATFSVTATGTAPLAYQWRRNGGNISGATSATYTTPPTTAADNGVQFSVVVSNASGTVTSANALLTVNAAPVITTHPANSLVNVGQTATFSVTATGAAPLAYQWRRNGGNISGATSATYTTPPTTAADNGAQFSVVVSNAAGMDTSNNALLQVLTPPSITAQPAHQTVSSGQTATFTVSATGSLPIAYQWYRNGAAISGATSPIYTTPVVTSVDHGVAFSVVVTNPAGSVTSANAILSVIYVATNSRKIAVSGELADASGNPVGYPTPVTVDAIVRLYNQATAGTLLYTEAFLDSLGKGVTVNNGLFVARLGEGTTGQNLQQVISGNANLWVEITIDDGTPDVLTPRTPLTASAYALGGTPAPALAPVLEGAGDPNQLGLQAEVGATYVNQNDQSTWFKLKSVWKRLD